MVSQDNLILVLYLVGRTEVNFRLFLTKLIDSIIILQMKPVLKNGSAFNVIENSEDQDKLTYLASKKAEEVLKNSQPIELAKTKFQGQQLPPLVSILIHIFISLVKGPSKEQIGDKIGMGLFANILSTHIKLPLLRLIAQIIEKKLYHREGARDEISYSVIFKNCLLSVFLSIVSENSSLIGMDRIVNFHRNLMTENYILYVPIYLYFMYGGGLFTIERKIFKNSFTKVMANLSYVLSKQETIMTRNFEEIKKNKFQSDVLYQSLNIACSASNKDYMNEISERLCFLLFKDKEYIKKEEFCQAVLNIPEEEKTRQFLFFYLNLLRVELQISQTAKDSETSKSQSGQTSFYASEMLKILKKCPYNGDNKCECKKCQCVRRNRQSAKLSQEKKRNAMEQLEPMKERIFELEVRNKQLEEENIILKELLNQLKVSPQFKSILMNTIEPMSKILRDN